MILRNLSYPTLMEIVNEYTRRFIRFILEGAQEQDLDSCRKTLDSLVRELRRRRTEKDLQDDDQLNSILELITDKANQN